MSDDYRDLEKRLRRSGTQIGTDAADAIAALRKERDQAHAALWALKEERAREEMEP
jgi:hypothetical protein